MGEESKYEGMAVNNKSIGLRLIAQPASHVHGLAKCERKKESEINL